MLVSGAVYASTRNLDRHTLGEALAAGRIPGIPPAGPGRPWLIDEQAADLVLASLTCPYVMPDGTPCGLSAIAESGGCEAHGHTLAGPGAKGVPRPPEVRAKISATKMGHEVTAETREKIRAGNTRYPTEERFCLACEDLKGKDTSLGKIVGWVIRKGGGKFCSECMTDGTVQRWIWEHIRGGKVGPSLFACAICGRPVERWPSQVNNAEASGWRFICEVCTPHYRKYRLAGQQAVRDADPEGEWLADEWQTALEKVWEIADEFEQITLKRWPKAKGRRPPLLTDFVIATFFRRGFSDKAILALLNAALGGDGKRRIPGLNAGEQLTRVKYVTTRRQRTQLRRPKG
jgi:hypothetical protein